MQILFRKLSVNRRTRPGTILLLGLILLPLTSHGATALESIRYSPDTTVALDGLAVQDGDVAEDNLAGIVTTIDLGSFPAGTDVDAYHRLPSGDTLLSFDTTVNLAGGLTARPADVVRFDGTSFSLEFDAFANGLSGGSNTDAVSIAEGTLVLSFDTTIQLPGFTAADEDLISFDDVNFGLFFDASSAGVAAGLDLDALHYTTDNGHLLVSFDGSGTAGGVTFNDDDVLEYDPVSGTWELAYSGSAHHADWTGADLDALHATSAFSDQDGDGIADSVDGEISGGTFDDQSNLFSDNFTDQHLGGSSFGFIANRDGLLFTIQNTPAPEGLLVEASGSGNATVNACGFPLQITDGDSIEITCSTLKVQVPAGPIEIRPHETIQIDVPTGATVSVTELSEGEFSIENASADSLPIIVTAGDQQIQVIPGNFIVVNAPLPRFGFEIDRAKIDFQKKDGKDKARIRGKLDSNLFNNEGDGVSRNVTVTVGPLSESLTLVEKGKKRRKWEYKRPKYGEGNIKRIVINWKNGKFGIRVDKADLAGITNPVTISIRIGNHLGEETILMREKKRHWDYKARSRR